MSNGRKWAHQEKIKKREVEPVPEIANHPRKRLFLNLHEEYWDLETAFLTALGIRKRLTQVLMNHGYETLGDLKGIRVSKLSSIITEKNIEILGAVEKRFEQPFIDLFEEVLEEKAETNQFEMVLLRAEGYTLQYIGELRGYTRERARQVIKKFNTNIDPFMLPIVEDYIEEKGYVTVQEIMDVYEDEDFERIMLYWCKSTDYYQYVDFAELFLPADFDLEGAMDDLLEFAEELIGEGVSLSDHLDEIEEAMDERNLSFMDQEAFVNFLLSNGYKVYGDYAAKTRQSYGFLCAKAVAKYFPNGVKLYENRDLQRLRQYVLEEYGDIGVSDDDRALSTRLFDYTVLCGRGAVTAEENIQLDLPLLEEIKDYIDQVPEKEIYYSEVFAKFEDRIRERTNIDNYHFLHGVLKLYYSDDFDFSNRDYLTKSGENLQSGKLSVKLRQFILDQGRPLHRNEIKERFSGMTDIVIINAVAADETLFQWDYNYFYSTELLQVSDEMRDFLEQQILAIMEQNGGYCSDILIYDVVQETHPEFIEENQIQRSNNLYFLCAKLFADEFDFRRPHIGKKGLLESISVKNVALHLLGHPVELHYSAYQQIARNLQWSHVTSGMVFNEIEMEYIRVADDVYIRKDSFGIQADVVANVERVLRRHMDEGFLPLLTFDSWDELPEYEHEWNVYFLKTLIVNYMPSLKLVEPRARDRRYEKGIVLDLMSPLVVYEDIVVEFLRKNEIYEISENELQELLIENGIVYKIIPRELYSGTNISYDAERAVFCVSKK